MRSDRWPVLVAALAQACHSPATPSRPAEPGCTDPTPTHGTAPPAQPQGRYGWWNADDQTCDATGAAIAGFPCDAVQLGVLPRDGGIPCAEHSACTPDEFCGAGACRRIDESWVTACLSQVALYGRSGLPPAPVPGPPPDLSLSWIGGPSFAYDTFGDLDSDSCRSVLSGMCSLVPLQSIAGSTVTLTEWNHTAPFFYAEIGQYEVGTLDEVLDHLDSCWELPLTEDGPTSMNAHVWVTIAYP